MSIRSLYISSALLTSSILGLTTSVYAEETSPKWLLELETGAVSFASNDVRIPGDTGTPFDMLDVLGTGADPFARINVSWQLNNKHRLGFVAAPLVVEGSGALKQTTDFAGQTFEAGATDGRYQFSTYRFTWGYNVHQTDKWRWDLGVTGLIRDADISLEQGDIQASDDNVGFVPLLHVLGRYQINDRWHTEMTLDGLAGGPGRAIDLGLKAYYDIDDHWQLGVGYRLLEGGADTDDVYNFSWLNFATVSIGYRF